MSKQIFRKVALERLSSPEQLDQLMQVTTPRGWLALLGLGGLLTVALIWGVFGSIPTQVVGPTILIKTGGVKNLVSTYTGQIETLAVAAGDVITEGQLVATITQLDQAGTQQVLSPYTGRVLELKVDRGSLVDRGAALASLERVGEDVKLEAVMYLAPIDGKKLAPGMEAQISPSTIAREEYGFMLGKVTVVGEFPSTYQGMLRVLGSDELVQALSAGVAPIEVHLDLLPDAQSVSGYTWSSGRGPAIAMQSGLLGTATIITGQQRPISFILR